MEEVQTMLEAGEVDIAIDELRWLLTGCGDFVDAHAILGQLALEAGDLQLARGHLGYGFELGLKAIPHAFADTLPADLPTNEGFFACGMGLAECLAAQGDKQKSLEVLRRLIALDPQDSVGAAAALDALTHPPMVQLSFPPPKPKASE